MSYRTLRAVVVSALCIGLLPAAACAQEEVDLLRHFEEVSDAWTIPETDLVVAAFDISGDGRDELFLAATAMAGGGQLTFHVYSAAGDREPYRYQSSLAFWPEWLYYDSESRILEVLGPTADPWDAALYRYRLGKNGIESLGKAPDPPPEAKGQSPEDHRTKSLRWRDEAGIRFFQVSLPVVKGRLEQKEDGKPLVAKSLLAKQPIPFDLGLLRGQRVLDLEGRF